MPTGIINNHLVFSEKGNVNANFFLVSVLLSVVTLGCSTKLQVERLENANHEKPLVGPVYYLPKGGLDIVVKRQLKKCIVLDVSTERPEGGIEIELAVGADVTPKFFPDLANPYLIKYEELNAAFKKTTLNVELYENGTLKKINGSIKDRTGVVIQNTTKGAVQIARMVMGVPSVPGAHAPLRAPSDSEVVDKQDNKYANFCNPETTKAIEHFEFLSSEIKRLEKALPALAPNARPAKEVELQNTKTAHAKYAAHLTHQQIYPSIPNFQNGQWKRSLPVSPSIFLKWFHFPENQDQRYGVRHVNHSWVESLLTLKNEIEVLEKINPKKLKNDVDILMKELDKLENEEKLLRTKAEAESDPTQKERLEQDANNKNQEVKNKRTDIENLNLKAKKDTYNQVSLNASLGQEIRDIARELDAIAEIDISKNQLALSSEKNLGNGGHLVYRQPGPANLTICKFSSCEEKNYIIHQNTYQLPQAGIYTTLPLENGMFDDNVLTAKFGQSGNLESFDYITESQAEAASATFAQMVGAAGQIVDAERDSEGIKLQRELNRLNLENQILEAQSKQNSLLTE